MSLKPTIAVPNNVNDMTYAHLHYMYNNCRPTGKTKEAFAKDIGYSTSSTLVTRMKNSRFDNISKKRIDKIINSYGGEKACFNALIKAHNNLVRKQISAWYSISEASKYIIDPQNREALMKVFDINIK